MRDVPLRCGRERGGRCWCPDPASARRVQLPADVSTDRQVGASMSGEDLVLGVMLRQALWTLDDLARDIPAAGRVSAEHRREVADVFADLARLLRSSADRMETPTVDPAAERTVIEAPDEPK